MFTSNQHLKFPVVSVSQHSINVHVLPVWAEYQLFVQGEEVGDIVKNVLVRAYSSVSLRLPDRILREKKLIVIVFHR